MTSPTQRSLAACREVGYFCAITEHWNPWSRTKQDLFGFVDILCLRENRALAIQTTSGTNVAARIKKIMACPGAVEWLKAWPQRQIFVHGWARRGPRGKRKTWTCREVEVKPFTLDNQQKET